MPINEINLKRSIRPHLLFNILMLWVRFFLCVLPRFKKLNIFFSQRKTEAFVSIHYKQKSFVFIAVSTSHIAYNSSTDLLKSRQIGHIFRKNDLMASCQCKVINQLLYPFIHYMLCIMGS